MHTYIYILTVFILIFKNTSFGKKCPAYASPYSSYYGSGNVTQITESHVISISAKVRLFLAGSLCKKKFIKNNNFLINVMYIIILN